MDENMHVELEFESFVIQRVRQLKQAGLWTSGVLRVKSVVPPTGKIIWDHLLEDVTHMAEHFRAERLWKRKEAKKCGRTILNHFRNKEIQAAKHEKGEEEQRKLAASQVAALVMQFWSNCERVVDHKMNRLHDIGRRQSLEAKLKEVLDSSAKVIEVQALDAEERAGDGEFEPYECESDYEDSIEKEEELENRNDADHQQEIDELESDNNMTVEQLLAKYKYYVDPSVVMAVAGPSKRKRNDKPEESSRKRPKRGENDDENSNDLSSLLSITGTKKCEEFQPSGYTLESAKVNITRPILLAPNVKLREYQQIGVDWLVNLYKTNLNGILADEMGLGKTIQAIALLAYLAEVEHNWGPHLIIVPSSIVMNWEVEFVKFCPGFKILTYGGSQKQRKLQRQGWSVPNSFQICITSYTTVVQDFRCFRRKEWEYMILDEAHHIKNFESLRWQTLLQFNTKHRLLLTGTPLQNNIMELWSLLHFLMPQMFESHSEFKKWFSKPIEEMVMKGGKMNDEILQQFHKILRPFVLRRVKSEVEKQMPRKFEHVVKCPLSKRQSHLYEEFMSRTDTRNTLNSGSFISMLGVLMQLRKVCNHPDLFEPRPIVSPLLVKPVSIPLPKMVWDIEMKDQNPLNIVPFSDHCIVKDSSKTMIVEKIHAASEIVKVVEPPTVTIRFAESNASKDGFTGLWTLIDYQGETAQVNSDSIDDELEDQNSNLFSPESESLLGSPPSWKDSESGFSMSPTSPFLGRPPAVIPIHENSETEEESYPTYFLSDRLEDYALPAVEMRKSKDRKATLETLGSILYRRTQTASLFNLNTVQACKVIGKIPALMNLRNNRRYRAPGQINGYAAIVMIQEIRQRKSNLFHHPLFLRKIAGCLPAMLRTLEDVMRSIRLDLIIYIPAVGVTNLPEMIYNPTTSTLQNRFLQNRDIFKRQCAAHFGPLYPIISRFVTSFPDVRLLEYDCGKLKVLSGLLRKLKQGGHKVLLFTQMTKVLHMLETFLNHHGYRYLRLDGGTKIEQRQLMVDRFNKDEKIFCFLLSTRAGGLGINLTGADTVIFYDSDWNPTIDAQAQDRCHRIGQMRDVHIYRLVSENTVEENILRTSNHKRLLGEHAIEDGQFNLKYYEKKSMRSIFGFGEQTESTVDEGDDNIDKEELEKALATVEDDVEDRKAAEDVQNEVKAEANEFNEESHQGSEYDLESLKEKFIFVYNSMNAVERYCVQQLDPTFTDWTAELIENFTKCELDNSYSTNEDLDSEDGRSNESEEDSDSDESPVIMAMDESVASEDFNERNSKSSSSSRSSLSSEFKVASKKK